MKVFEPDNHQATGLAVFIWEVLAIDTTHYIHHRKIAKLSQTVRLGFKISTTCIHFNITFPPHYPDLT